MRRRGAEAASSASADFYRRYSAPEKRASRNIPPRHEDHCHGCFEEDVRAGDEAEGAPRKASAHALFVWLALLPRRTWAALGTWLAAIAGLWSWLVASLRLQVPQEGDLDALDACVDCGQLFSPWRVSRWRQPCGCCGNVFCGGCLALRHRLHDGKGKGAGGKAKQAVCSYCFFQLCARHCPGLGCCGALRVGTLKRFLARKGLSTAQALEKEDLVASVRAWALDLAAAEAAALFGHGDDL